MSRSIRENGVVMSKDNSEKLASILFDGNVKAGDIKIMPGSRQDLDRERVADALLSSLNRMGLVQNNTLVNKNN
jgi:hypothetical protein